MLYSNLGDLSKYNGLFNEEPKKEETNDYIRFIKVYAFGIECMKSFEQLIKLYGVNDIQSKDEGTFGNYKIKSYRFVVDDDKDFLYTIKRILKGNEDYDLWTKSTQTMMILPKFYKK